MFWYAWRVDFVGSSPASTTVPVLAALRGLCVYINSCVCDIRYQACLLRGYRQKATACLATVLISTPRTVLSRYRKAGYIGGVYSSYTPRARGI